MTVRVGWCALRPTAISSRPSLLCSARRRLERTLQPGPPTSSALASTRRPAYSSTSPPLVATRRTSRRAARIVSVPLTAPPATSGPGVPSLTRRASVVHCTCGWERLRIVGASSVGAGAGSAGSGAGSREDWCGRLGNSERVAEHRHRERLVRRVLRKLRCVPALGGRRNERDPGIFFVRIRCGDRNPQRAADVLIGDHVRRLGLGVDRLARSAVSVAAVPLTRDRRVRIADERAVVGGQRLADETDARDRRGTRRRRRRRTVDTRRRRAESERGEQRGAGERDAPCAPACIGAWGGAWMLSECVGHGGSFR
jgi:hypothetical protein